jgi:chloramphenicol-sensitive protein RarD
VSATTQNQRTGVIQAVLAYSIWGFMPVFFKLFGDVPPLEIVSHRVIWCAPLLIAILVLRREIANLANALRNPKTLRLLLLSSVLIAVNWGVYIFAVASDHVIAASLGYFLNPLFNILLGYLLFSERLSRIQLCAVAIATIGVVILATGALSTLWISVTLGLSFSLYGAVRKTAPVESLPGLSAETMILAPFAIGYAIWIANTGPGIGWGSSAGMNATLMCGAIITAVPLLLFGSAARKIGYSTIGFIQYIGPSIQFLFAIFVYHEPMNAQQIICFGLIWSALALFTWDAVSRFQSASKAAKQDAS